MSKVLLTSVVEGQLPAGHDNLRPLEVLRACAQIDRFGVHEIVTDPARADLILFVEQRGPGLYQAPFWRHPLVRRHPERCFAYCAIDSVVPFLPGIYPSQPRRGPSPARYRGGHYLNGLFRPNPGALPMPAAPPLLYSFRGRFATHRIRPRLARLQHPRGVVLDTEGRMDGRAHGRIFMGYGQGDVDAFYTLCRDSAFMLAPRGYGASSMRLFEAMQVGRAPVIVGDAWIPPVGPDWGAFSVRVAERDIASIPDRLEALEPRAEAMGLAARATWDEWFAEDVTFHRVVSWCLDIAADRRWTEPLERLAAYRRLLDEDVLLARGRSVRERIGRLAARLRGSRTT